MSSTLHKTKGIVLRSVKYGETSIIAGIYTELFGMQSYLVQGVRTSSKKGPGKANYFQPGTVLDMVVYHNELKQLQRIKEFKWAWLYRHTLSDVVKHSVLLYMTELMQKCLRQPEHHPELFHFMEDALQHLDQAERSTLANYPLYFSLHFCSFFGFRINDEMANSSMLLDLKEGSFVSEPPQHAYYIEGEMATLLAELLKVMQPHELNEITLQQQQRRKLLEAIELYYALHIAEFGKMKSAQILQEVLSA
ncbi:MAG: DNA repair protein RecO [Bacteroidetes bacterium]|nr:DNA repair protein RecO [Bacteroidota bacterium]